MPIRCSREIYWLVAPEGERAFFRRLGVTPRDFRVNVTRARSYDVRSSSSRPIRENQFLTWSLLDQTERKEETLEECFNISPALVYRFVTTIYEPEYHFPFCNVSYARSAPSGSRAYRRGYLLKPSSKVIVRFARFSSPRLQRTFQPRIPRAKRFLPLAVLKNIVLTVLNGNFV